MVETTVTKDTYHPQYPNGDDKAWVTRSERRRTNGTKPTPSIRLAPRLYFKLPCAVSGRRGCIRPALEAWCVLSSIQRSRLREISIALSITMAATTMDVVSYKKVRVRRRAQYML